MNIKDFGVSSYCLINEPLESALDHLCNYTDTVEILSDGIHSLFFHEEICHSFDLTYAVHAPSGDSNIAVENEHMRRASIKVLSELSEICDSIGAVNLVIHPGYMTTTTTAEQAKRSMHRSLHELSEIQQNYEVRFTIENMGNLNLLFFQDTAFLALLDELDLAFNLDIGHANLTGNLNEFLELGSPAHAHIHDNDGTFDSHAPCGTGTIDFCRTLALLPEDALKIIEVNSFEKVEESYSYLSSIL